MIFNFQYRCAVHLIIASIPFVATAQGAEQKVPDTQTITPSTLYQSAFTDYQNYRDPELMPWRTANEEVRKSGSMAGMSMEGESAGNVPGPSGTQNNKGQ